MIALSPAISIESVSSTLSRTIAIYETVESLGGLDAFKSLTYSHFRYVLGLEPAQQKKLLTAAELPQWKRCSRTAVST